MKHKLLFLCSLFVGAQFPLSPALASRPVAENVKSTAPTTHAMLTLGARYRLGGSSPLIGFDCSGLVTHVFEQAWGMVLPHNAQAQSRIESLRKSYWMGRFRGGRRLIPPA